MTTENDRYTPRELGELLRVAADLQVGADLADATLTHGEVERIAAEAGIERKHLLAARRALWPRGEIEHSTTAPDQTIVRWVGRGLVTPHDALRLIADLEAAIPLHGGMLDQSVAGVWRVSGKSGVIQVAMRDSSTECVAVAKPPVSPLLAQSVGGVVAGGLGAMIGMSVAISLGASVEAAAIALPTGLATGAAVGVLSTRVLLRRAAAAWRARVERVLDQFTEAPSGTKDTPEGTA
jgi:hypothetical protein